MCDRFLTGAASWGDLRAGCQRRESCDVVRGLIEQREHFGATLAIAHVILHRYSQSSGSSSSLCLARKIYGKTSRTSMVGENLRAPRSLNRCIFPGALVVIRTCLSAGARSS